MYFEENIVDGRKLIGMSQEEYDAIVFAVSTTLSLLIERRKRDEPATEGQRRVQDHVATLVGMSDQLYGVNRDA